MKITPWLIALTITCSIYASSSPHEILRTIQNQIDYIHKQHYNERIIQLEKTIGQLESTIEELSFSMKKIAAKEPAPHKQTASPSNNEKKPQKEGCDAQSLYHTALSKIKLSQRTQALTMLEQLIQEHPQSKWAGLAYYWKGEILLQQNKPLEAKKAFNVVITHHKTSAKYDDAVFKQVGIHLQQNEITQAKKLLQTYIQTHSSSPNVQKARDILNKIPSA